MVRTSVLHCTQILVHQDRLMRLNTLRGSILVVVQVVEE